MNLRILFAKNTSKIWVLMNLIPVNDISLPEINKYLYEIYVQIIIKLLSAELTHISS